jgi:hypothetical protein
MPQLALGQLARAYRVALIDCEDGHDGLIVSSGAGIMTAARDVIDFRYVFDIDASPTARLADFLLWAERFVPDIVVVGWFSLTDPEPLRAAIRGLREPARVLAYTPFTRLGCTHVESLGELHRTLARIHAERARAGVHSEQSEPTGHREGPSQLASVLEDPGEGTRLVLGASRNGVGGDHRADIDQTHQSERAAGELPGGRATGADEQPPAVGGVPSPDLNGLDAAGDQTGPRVAY